MRYLLLIILFTSCTVPRLSAPSADDLAGSPMYHGFDVTLTESLEFDESWLISIDSIESEQESEQEIDQSNCNHWWWAVAWYDGDKCHRCGWVYHEPPPCNHIYVLSATPARDSTIAYPKTSGWTTLEYRFPPDSIKIEAKRPCICILCHDVKKCF